MKRILIATDLSEASDAVLATGFEIAAELSAEVTVLYTLTSSHLDELRADLPAESAYVDSLMTRLNADLDRQIARIPDSPGGISTQVARGEVGEVVLAQATALEADMIVIGIRSRSRIGKLLMGSDVQEILLASRCPVLGVPV